MFWGWFQCSSGKFWEEINWYCDERMLLIYTVSSRGRPSLKIVTTWRDTLSQRKPHHYFCNSYSVSFCHFISFLLCTPVCCSVTARLSRQRFEVFYFSSRISHIDSCIIYRVKWTSSMDCDIWTGPLVGCCCKIQSNLEHEAPRTDGKNHIFYQSGKWKATNSKCILIHRAVWSSRDTL